MSLNSSLLEGLPDETILCVSSFLLRSDLAPLVSASKVLAAMRENDAMWESIWPWRSRLCRPLQTIGSWQRANRIVAAYKKCTTFTPVPIPTDDTLAGPGESVVVTCSAHSPSFMAVGCGDGIVRVYDLRSGVVNKFALNSGSVQHMQLVVRPPATITSSISSANAPTHPLVELYVGSWNGTVHAIDIASGTTRLVIRQLGGPVLALCVAGNILAASAGDGRIGVFDIKDRGAERCDFDLGA